MELKILDKAGSETGRLLTLPESVFEIEPNDHAIYLDVKRFLAAQRQGTHKAKERAEIIGSTKKLKKQKGTGTARAGSIKSPIFRGGGRIFGPRPRDYSFKLNKKVKDLARKSALSYKAKDEKITLVEDFSMDTPHTQTYLEILDSLSVSSYKTLLILADYNQNVFLSSRNLPKARVLPVSQLSTYDIMNADNVLITEEALPKLEEILN